MKVLITSSISKATLAQCMPSSPYLVLLAKCETNAIMPFGVLC
jgi:hypothetical protein